MGIDLIEHAFNEVSAAIALVVEALSILTVFIGSILAVYRLFALFVHRDLTIRGVKEVWTRYAMWLLLGLEFLLAADIIRTAIAPSWTEIGQLAAIATIRTFLNFFLTRDIEKTASGLPTLQG
jgi:uncharacterized membrane protein